MDIMNKLIFSKRLKELMSENKTTQQDLANKTNMTRQAISQYAVGSVLPNIEKLYLISQYFSVSTDFLLGLSNYRNFEKEKNKHITQENRFGGNQHIFDFPEADALKTALSNYQICEKALQAEFIKISEYKIDWRKK